MRLITDQDNDSTDTFATATNHRPRPASSVLPRHSPATFRVSSSSSSRNSFETASDRPVHGAVTAAPGSSAADLHLSSGPTRDLPPSSLPMTQMVKRSRDHASDGPMEGANCSQAGAGLDSEHMSDVPALQASETALPPRERPPSTIEEAIGKAGADGSTLSTAGGTGSESPSDDEDTPGVSSVAEAEEEEIPWLSVSDTVRDHRRIHDIEQYQCRAQIMRWNKRAWKWRNETPHGLVVIGLGPKAIRPAAAEEARDSDKTFISINESGRDELASCSHLLPSMDGMSDQELVFTVTALKQVPFSLSDPSASMYRPLPEPIRGTRFPQPIKTLAQLSARLKEWDDEYLAVHALQQRLPSCWTGGITHSCVPAHDFNSEDESVEIPLPPSECVVERLAHVAKRFNGEYTGYQLGSLGYREALQGADFEGGAVYHSKEEERPRVEEQGGNTESAGEAYRLTYLVDAVRSISPAADTPATTVHGGDAAARQSYSDTRAAGFTADEPRSKWLPILTVRSSRLPPRADTLQADEIASRPLHMPERHNAYYTAAMAAIERTMSSFECKGKSASACQGKSNVGAEGGMMSQGCSADADEDKEKAAVVNAIVAALREQADLIPDSSERGGSVEESGDVLDERLCRNALGEQSNWKAPLRPVFVAKGL